MWEVKENEQHRDSEHEKVKKEEWGKFKKHITHKLSFLPSLIQTFFHLIPFFSLRSVFSCLSSFFFLPPFLYCIALHYLHPHPSSFDFSLLAIFFSTSFLKLFIAFLYPSSIHSFLPYFFLLFPTFSITFIASHLHYLPLSSFHRFLLYFHLLLLSSLSTYPQFPFLTISPLLYFIPDILPSVLSSPRFFLLSLYSIFISPFPVFPVTLLPSFSSPLFSSLVFFYSKYLPSCATLIPSFLLSSLLSPPP